ncbi:MAG: hypothetical protein J5685_09150 [Clostridiales bacterium]|nr:hypothetical protein [Clostridiales bacterium]
MIISAADRKLDFTIAAPPSKSVYHRELIVRFLCGDTACLSPDDNDNNDIKATKACLRSLDAARKNRSSEAVLPCGESGSTIRFLIPVAAAYLLGEDKVSQRLVFTTEGRLFDRPFGELADAMKPHGIRIEKDPDTRSIIVTGHMTPGKYVIDGSVSSQYISGLLMALPLFDAQSSIEVTGQMKSVHYIELTLDALSKYKTPAKQEGNTFLPSFGGYKGDISGQFKVEGDWSNGAFLLCLQKWSDIKVTNLDPASRQGDKAIVDFLKFADEIHSEPVTWDCTDTPDIAPYMAVVSPFLFGQMTLTGIGRLRIKESDRVKAVREQLGAIGVKTEETEDTLTIYEYESPRNEDHKEPIVLSSYNDHRMAMCAILIAVILKARVDIDDLKCLNKSFPEFQEIIRRELMP